MQLARGQDAVRMVILSPFEETSLWSFDVDQSAASGIFHQCRPCAGEKETRHPQHV